MRHPEAMPVRPPSELLDALKALSVPQFEGLVLRLGVELALLSAPYAPQAIRAVELLRLLNQRPGGLEALEDALARESTGAGASVPSPTPAASASAEESVGEDHLALRPELFVVALGIQWLGGRAHMAVVGPHDTLQHTWRLIARTAFCALGIVLAVWHPGSAHRPRTFSFARHSLLCGCAWMVTFTYLELFWFRAQPSPGPFVWFFLNVGLPSLYGSLWTTWLSLFLVIGELYRRRRGQRR